MATNILPGNMDLGGKVLAIFFNDHNTGLIQIMIGWGPTAWLAVLVFCVFVYFFLVMPSKKFDGVR